MSGKIALGLLILACAGPSSCLADTTPAAEPATAPPPATVSSAAPATSTPPPAPALRKRKRLLDFNRDGKINLKDALRVAGFHGSFDRIASVGMDGRLTMRSPMKLLGEALLDLSDDGKISPHAPLDYIGLPLMNISRVAKLSYNGHRLTLQRTWKY